jgi:hypothetical protein
MTDTFKLIGDELYQRLVRLAACDERWAAYFLLVNTCYAIATKIPTTEEALSEADIERLLIDAIEHIGRAVYNVLPGGLDEFYHYMPQWQRTTASR